MPEMLLLNPRTRRSSKKRKSRKANPKRSASSRSTRRRRNPLPMFGRVRRARHASRRRRNPIALGRLSASSVLAMVKDAMIGAGGALVVQAAFNKLAPMLPAQLRPTPGKVGAGDAVLMLFTILAGRALKGVTRGASMKAAQGALTVQSVGILKQMLPPGLGLGDSGMGYYSPALIEPGSAVIGPAMDGYDGDDLSAFSTGSTALLSGDGSPMLNQFEPSENVSPWR